ncbi:hypothetical protein [Brevibacterium pigmentatum]|uniref:hypothetical protein n=1 Tax=Brevibacterium pigmentatum TaxID=1496080 RepID=UPI0014248388|nr:hypothetical protein [Brevibacterium pigmentatum]
MNWDEKAKKHADGTKPEADWEVELIGDQTWEVAVIGGANWQRDQLRTDEAVARLADFLHEDERQETVEEHEAWCHAPECEARLSYSKFARAAIDALLGEEP